MLLPLTAAACGGGSDSSGTSGTINYWLWDSNQQPGYQQCANDFQAAHPGTTIKITQLGWDDYWSKLTTSFVSGTAPDVFTNHLGKYGEFVNKKVLLSLDDQVSKDAVDLSVYQAGLADLWVGPDGKRYGLPKDWDTIAVFYNKKLADEAGVTAEQLAGMTWNPTDGGTYEKVIARLTVDRNGKRGDEPGFDKTKVKTYGMWLENSGNGVGQTQWSMYAVSNGWQFTDKNPWGSHYNYDDPKFQNTITWWKSLIDKGYMPPLKATSAGGQSVNWNDMLAAGKAAMATNGSWMTGQVFGAKSDSFEPAVAPMPAGPSGKRASMFNGLADSIYAGTKNKDAAWQWVKYLGSEACQKVIAEQGVVFPAISSTLEASTKKFEEKGVDVSAFTVHVKDQTTFLFPITDHAAQIEAIMKPAMDAVMNGSAPVSSLTQANEQVNALFG
ncbi:sugar ABC transporter substrate-binding protein, partial [Micromonospora sp. KC606]|uniref:ABC transporter substrate-binding protein n=1 Tax=Micromonospora sp. KC606 TaxID=2530379 RepID=UPI001FB59BC6